MFFLGAPDSSPLEKKLWKVGGFYTLRHKCYIRQALRLLLGVSVPGWGSPRLSGEEPAFRFLSRLFLEHLFGTKSQSARLCKACIAR